MTASLANQQVIVLYLAQMLGDPRPRGTNDSGYVLLANRNRQQRAVEINND